MRTNQYYVVPVILTELFNFEVTCPPVLYFVFDISGSLRHRLDAEQIKNDFILLGMVDIVNNCKTNSMFLFLPMNLLYNVTLYHF